MSRACSRRSTLARGTTWKMNVEDALPAGAPLSCAIRMRERRTLLHGARHALRREDGRRERVCGRSNRFSAATFRDHERVSIGLRHRVHEGERVLVLADLCAGISPRRMRAKMLLRRRHAPSSVRPRFPEYSERSAAGRRAIRPKMSQRAAAARPARRRIWRLALLAPGRVQLVQALARAGRSGWVRRQGSAGCAAAVFRRPRSPLLRECGASVFSAGPPASAPRAGSRSGSGRPAAVRAPPGSGAWPASVCLDGQRPGHLRMLLARTFSRMANSRPAGRGGFLVLASSISQ